MIKKIILISLIELFFIVGCNSIHINPVKVELIVINNTENKTNSQQLEKVFFDPYILFLNQQKRFFLTEKDIRDIQVQEGDSNILVSFYLKRKRVREFSKFTEDNLNSLIAVKINGKVNSIARVDEVIDNGEIQFVANIASKNYVVAFLKQFFS